MAIKYRISESGIQKVVEVLNDSTVIGTSKYGPKELSIINNSGTIQIKDALSGKVLYSGDPSSFVNSSNQVFGQTAQDVVSAITTVSDGIKINIAELEGLELVDNQLLPDLSAYAKTSEVESYVSTQLAPALERLDVTETELTQVEKHIGINNPAIPITWVLEDDQALCNPNMSVTFTVPSNGKAKISAIIQSSVTNAGTFYAHFNQADPGENGQLFEKIQDPFAWHSTQMYDYIDAQVGDDGRGERFTIFSIPGPGAFEGGYEVVTTAAESVVVTGLTPGEEVTYYLWTIAGAVSFLTTATFKIIGGIKAFKVED